MKVALNIFAKQVKSLHTAKNGNSQSEAFVTAENSLRASRHHFTLSCKHIMSTNLPQRTICHVQKLKYLPETSVTLLESFEVHSLVLDNWQENMECNACAIQVDDGPIIGDLFSTSQSLAVYMSFEHLESNPILSLHVEFDTTRAGSKEWCRFCWFVNEIRDEAEVMDKLQIDGVSQREDVPKSVSRHYSRVLGDTGSPI